MPGEIQAGANVPKNERGENQGDRADNGAPAITDNGKQDAAIDQECRESKKPKEPKHRKPLKRFQRISVVIQSVSFLALLAYTGVSCLMWREMQKSNEAARKSLEISERAWVGVFSVDPFSVKPVGKEIRATIRNSGRSTATNIQTTLNLIESTNPKAPDMMDLDGSITVIRKSKATLIPGADYSVAIIIDDHVRALFDQAKVPGIFWYFGGRLDYFDGFRYRYEKFCYVNDGAVRWDACETGNSAN